MHALSHGPRFPPPRTPAPPNPLNPTPPLPRPARPCDLIKPYRLDMGRKLGNPEGSDLYAFWSAAVTQRINEWGRAVGNVGTQG